MQGWSKSGSSGSYPGKQRLQLTPLLPISPDGKERTEMPEQMTLFFKSRSPEIPQAMRTDVGKGAEDLSLSALQDASFDQSGAELSRGAKSSMNSNLKIVGSNVTYLRPSVPPINIPAADEGPTMVKMVRLCSHCHARPIEFDSRNMKTCQRCLRMLVELALERRADQQIWLRMKKVGVLLAIVVFVLITAPYVAKSF
jgi:hypothetical protein